MEGEDAEDSEKENGAANGEGTAEGDDGTKEADKGDEKSDEGGNAGTNSHYPVFGIIFTTLTALVFSL